MKWVPPHFLSACLSGAVCRMFDLHVVGWFWPLTPHFLPQAPPGMIPRALLTDPKTQFVLYTPVLCLGPGLVLPRLLCVLISFWFFPLSFCSELWCLWSVPGAPRPAALCFFYFLLSGLLHQGENCWFSCICWAPVRKLPDLAFFLKCHYSHSLAISILWLVCWMRVWVGMGYSYNWHFSLGISALSEVFLWFYAVLELWKIRPSLKR